MEEDIVHTSVPPFEFYHLKPGAKARHAKKKGGVMPSLFSSLTPSWLLPFNTADLPYIQRLLLDVFILSPSLWLKYLCARPPNPLKLG